MSSNGRKRFAAPAWLYAVIWAALAGCTQTPVTPEAGHDSATSPSLPAASPNEPVESAEAESAAEESVSPPDAAPPPSPPSRPELPSIAVGVQARAARYQNLASGELALASRDLGYFIDVHEARLRQALAETPVRMERGDGFLRVTIPGSLSFAPGSAAVSAQGRPVLATIAEVLTEFRNTQVSVHGHTDRSGDSDFNRQLSERRALAVAQFLAARGVARERLVGIGHGEEQPAIDGDSQEAQAANRRIEIEIRPIVTGTGLASVGR